jgi:hypothetical protein
LPIKGENCQASCQDIAVNGIKSIELGKARGFYRCRKEDRIMLRYTRRAIELPLLLLALAALPLSASGAITIDVTAVGASAFGDSNNVMVLHVDVDPTGTGFIDPFLRIHHQDSEHGYNTDYRNAGMGGPSLNLLDDITDTNFTNAITLGQIREVFLDTDNNGSLDTAYREFRLDLGEPGNATSESGLMNFSRLQFFLSTSAEEHIVGDVWNDTLGAATLVYNLDATNDYDFTLRDLTSGNGALDYLVYVRSSLFGTDDSKYVYLYSMFGSPPPTADGTFEEWSAQAPPPTASLPGVPEPTSLAIWCLGLVAAGFGARRMRKQK